jgi:hypothetical protein
LIPTAKTNLYGTLLAELKKELTAAIADLKEISTLPNDSLDSITELQKKVTILENMKSSQETTKQLLESH